MKLNQYINTLYPVIIELAPKYGISTPKAIMAQAITESWKGNGISQLASKYNNFWGMKCGSNYKGRSVNLKTKEEYAKGVLTEIKDNFRVYENVKGGVEGYFDFIQMKRYQNLKNCKTDEEYITTIANDGWATSKTYISTNLKNLKYVPDNEQDIDVIYVTKYGKVAKEVIAGLWGNGADRKKRLELAGYDYRAVQTVVNRMLR